MTAQTDHSLRVSTTWRVHGEYLFSKLSLDKSLEIWVELEKDRRKRLCKLEYVSEDKSDEEMKQDYEEFIADICSGYDAVQNPPTYAEFADGELLPKPVASDTVVHSESPAKAFVICGDTRELCRIDIDGERFALGDHVLDVEVSGQQAHLTIDDVWMQVLHIGDSTIAVVATETEHDGNRLDGEQSDVNASTGQDEAGDDIPF